jgi:hypothetical protein
MTERGKSPSGRPHLYKDDRVHNLKRDAKGTVLRILPTEGNAEQARVKWDTGETLVHSLNTLILIPPGGT